MSVDPRELDFAVLSVSVSLDSFSELILTAPACYSVFLGKDAKSVLPTNSLWSLRVWLRVEGVDHQFFKTDELFVGRDLDFNAIGDASFARLAEAAPDHQVYKGYLGKALIAFTIRCVLVSLVN